MVKCSIINIGGELLKGRGGKSNTIASQLLSSYGVKIMYSITVGDSLEVIKESISSALKKDINIVLLIGGLGSTADDNTLKAVSETIDLPLKFSRQAMENVASFFAARDMDVPDEADSQANILEGAKLLKNPEGSCPGQIIELEKNKILIMLPGPPNETEYLIKEEVKKYIDDKFPSLISETTVFHITGMCEKDIENSISDILDTESLLEGPELDYNFIIREENVDLFVSVTGKDQILAEEVLYKFVSEIKDSIGENIYGMDEKTFTGVIGELLVRYKATLSVAESCTGGLLSSVITDAPGSSLYFKGGAVVYSNSEKTSRLNVPAKLIKNKGAVSKEVAESMAVNMRKMAKTDYSLSVTGYAGPAGGEKEKPGTAYIALASPDGVKSVKKKFKGSRKKVKKHFTNAALQLLWKKLKEEKE